MNNDGINENPASPAPAGDESSAPGILAVVQRYSVAVTCTLIAFAIRYWLTPILGGELPFMLFVAAALVAAWYGGAVTGIVSLLLGLMLAGHFFLPPHIATQMPYSPEALEFVRYFFTASLGIVLIEVLHRDRKRTRLAAEELRREVERRRRTEATLREAQAELARHAQELEQRVADRTARLTATVESLRGLLYHIAHNLRAPLRAMSGYSTLLAREHAVALNAEGRDFLDHISAAARRMDELIRDLLEYGRLGHVDLVLTNVSLERAVDRCLFQLDYEIKAKKAEVTVDRPLPAVWGDAEVLEQVLTNLLENALKFVSPGVAPRIRLRAEPRGSRVRIWVEDNGVGIDPRYHERIFGVFESLYPGSGQEGTGIGLAIVRQGAQRMEGQAGVDSEVGAGSRFWVELQAAH